MRFILDIRIWLHQGFHVNLTYRHGHGMCCRMSDPNQPGDVTSGSNVLNPPDTDRQGPTTRQQSAAHAMANAAAAAAAAAARASATPAPCASPGAQSVTATIDYHTLESAMSRLNDDSASNVEKGTQPKWDFKRKRLLTGCIRWRYGQNRMTLGTCLNIHQ